MHPTANKPRFNMGPILIYLAAALLAVQLIFPLPAMAADTAANTEGNMITLPGQAFTVILDEKPYNLNFFAFKNNQGIPMISISDCQQLFCLKLELNDKQELVMQGNGHNLILQPGTYTKYNSWQVITGPGNTNVQLDVFYIPLDRVAGEWKYKLITTPDTNKIELQSPGFTPAPPVKPPVNVELPAALPCWGSFNAVPSVKALWPDQEIIGGYYTTIRNSSAGRINNIKLSTAGINGQVLAPGQVFSFNRAVGERTIQKGYKVAPVYSGNRVVSGVGGGICQTSTTLFNAARESGMQVVERHHHTLPVHYVPSGYDATVSWGTADFKFRNVKNYPVKIQSQVYKNYVIFAITRAN